MCIRPSCWDFWLFFQPWPTGSNHSIVFWERVQHFHLSEGITEIFLYQNPISCFNAVTGWNLRIILKSLDQKKHHSMEITFWHIKGEGEILWWKYWSTIHFYAWKDSQILHDAFKEKKLIPSTSHWKKRITTVVYVISFRKSYERLNVLAPKEEKCAFFVHVVLICYVNLKYIFHPSAIV